MADRERSASIAYLLALTSSLGGLQVIWSVVLSNGTQYLISLGFSRPLTALVWIAGPLCGIFVQPIVGALSDSYRGPWGRRRPFLVLGTIGVTISILTLAFVEELIDTLLFYSDAQDAGLTRPLILVLAIIAIYCLNVSIQPIQVSARALVVECCPSHQQAQASAWSTYSIGVANTAGYLLGWMDIAELLHLERLSRFQCLSLVAVLSLALAVGIGCVFSNEKNSQVSWVRASEKSDRVAVWAHLLGTSRELPEKIRKVFQIQFCAWMGWFPLLYYTTEYIADLYTNSSSPANKMVNNSTSSTVSFDPNHPERLALLIFAVVSLLTSILMSLLQHHKSILTLRPHSHFGGHLNVSNIPDLGIVPIWVGGHILFALSMFATVFVNHPTEGLVLIAIVGVSWTITLWAPFAIIGDEIRYSLGDAGGYHDRVGAILSLHNIAISAPQIFAALVSYILLRLVDSLAWVFTAGGCAGLAAAYLTYKLDN